MVRSSFALLCLLVVVGCTDDDETRSELTTFNVGLAFGFVEEASARVDPIIEALNEADDDVVCIQELWTNQDDSGMWTTAVIDRVLSGVEDTYPHVYWQRTTVPDDAPESGCEVEEADALLACAQPACGELPPENLTDCVLANCSEEFNATSSTCQSCLVAQLGQPLDVIVSACRGVTRGGIVYDGHNGLALLSKHPLDDTEILEFDYALTARAALHAVVDVPAVGPMDVYCTHLAADLGGSISYPPDAPYDSFAAENAGQTQALLDWVDQTSTTDEVALLGDMNHGPALGPYQAEFPDSYRIVADANWDDPVTRLDPPQCTFCAANLLLQGEGEGGTIIDHVYLMLTHAQVEQTEIVFDAPIEVPTANGQRTRLNLSDHYGVRVTLGE